MSPKPCKLCLLLWQVMGASNAKRQTQKPLTTQRNGEIKATEVDKIMRIRYIFNVHPWPWAVGSPT